jgi:hypothetical protein
MFKDENELPENERQVGQKLALEGQYRSTPSRLRDIGAIRYRRR